MAALNICKENALYAPHYCRMDMPVVSRTSKNKNPGIIESMKVVIYWQILTLPNIANVFDMQNVSRELISMKIITTKLRRPVTTYKILSQWLLTVQWTRCIELNRNCMTVNASQTDTIFTYWHYKEQTRLEISSSHRRGMEGVS